MKKIVIAAIALAVLFIIIFSFLWKTMPPEPITVFAPERFRSATVVIDAGHGGEDGGAVSLSGIRESTINLAVAQKLDLIFGLYGVPASMIRREDISLHSGDCSTIREKKVSDLHNRVGVINETENAVLISIHQNYFEQPKYYGAQVFFSGTEGSMEFAQHTQEILRQTLDPGNQRAATKISDAVYLMKNIHCPAILVECGFLSNPAEDQLLQTPEYQLMIALSLAGAYLQYQQINEG